MYHQRKCLICMRMQGVFRVTLPGITGFQFDVSQLCLRAAADEQVGIDGIITFTPAVPAERRNQSGQVRRAACTGQPLGALRQNMLVTRLYTCHTGDNFQRIDIEIPGPIQLHAGKCAVIQLQFQHIRIPALGRDIQHAVCKERHRHRGAGFCIGSVVG